MCTVDKVCKWLISLVFPQIRTKLFIFSALYNGRYVR